MEVIKGGMVEWCVTRWVGGFLLLTEVKSVIELYVNTYRSNHDFDS
jgi:hypothetical protein